MAMNLATLEERQERLARIRMARMVREGLERALRIFDEKQSNGKRLTYNEICWIHGLLLACEAGLVELTRDELWRSNDERYSSRQALTVAKTRNLLELVQRLTGMSSEKSLHN